MWHTEHGDFPELCRTVEVLMNDGTVREDMMVKGKYGNYEWRDYANVKAWRYIEKAENNKLNTKENKSMKKNNRESRMETMQAAGIDTKKYFSINLPEGLKPGAVISLVIDERKPVITPEKVNKTDEQLENYNEICKCISNGYIRNTKLHRRWVMAQMFRMLNYESRNGEHCGYDAYLNDMYEYDYQFKMML